MIGYYGKEDRRLLTEIEDNLTLLRNQLALSLHLQKESLVLQQKILDALHGRTAVVLKFSLGLPK